MPRVTTLLESWLLSSLDPFWFPEELWCGKGERARPSSSSQTRSVVPFTGRLLCWAWLCGLSPSSLTAGNRVGSGRLGRSSPWLDARTGGGKSSLLGFAVFPVLSTRHRGAACVSERVLREGWREPGESFWREVLERESLRECINFYNWIRLTPILHTVLNYSTTGSRSWVIIWEFCGMQGLVVLWSLHGWSLCMMLVKRNCGKQCPCGHGAPTIACTCSEKCVSQKCVYVPNV